MTKVVEVKQLDKLQGAGGKTYNVRRVTDFTNTQTNRRSTLTILSMELDNELKSTYFTQNWLSTGKE